MHSVLVIQLHLQTLFLFKYDFHIFHTVLSMYSTHLVLCNI